MFQHLIGLLLVGLGLQTPSMPPSVLGDEDTNVAVMQETTGQAADKMKALREQVNSKRQELKQNVQNNLQNTRQQFQDSMASKAGTLEDRKKLRDQFKSEIEAKREEAKQQFQTQREAFKQRLETIKDENKKERVQNLDTKITDVNTKRTTQMTENLNKMDEVVARLWDKVNVLETDGKDVNAAKTALADAQSKITAAKTAVGAQAGKEYIIGVTTENNLGQDVKRSLDAIKKDFDAVQVTIKAAREAVTAAVKEIALLAEADTAPAQ